MKYTRKSFIKNNASEVIDKLEEVRNSSEEFFKKSNIRKNPETHKCGQDQVKLESCTNSICINVNWNIGNKKQVIWTYS